MATNIRLEQALAELAYSIIYADGKADVSEIEALDNMICSIFGDKANQVRNKFHMLGERSSPNIDQAYRNAMFAIRDNKDFFVDEIREKLIVFLETLANASIGLRAEEHRLVERFREDIRHI